ncbi:hypothetical protein GCM10010372_33620 [Streptomyces tauricus]|nr:hypothetical protein GCM10010372_33620 [Streptomyces tauricus]
MRGVPRLRNTAPRRHRALSAYLLRFCPYPRMTRCNNLLPGTARSPAHDSPGHQDTLMVLAEYGTLHVRLTGRTATTRYSSVMSGRLSEIGYKGS